MPHNNPYAVSIQPPQYAPGTRFTVSGRNRVDQQKSGDTKFGTAIKTHVDKNNEIIAAGGHASPHAQQARRAAWDAHDAASTQAQNWAKIKAEQQEMRSEFKFLEEEVKKLQKTK